MSREFVCIAYSPIPLRVELNVGVEDVWEWMGTVCISWTVYILMRGCVLMIW